MSKIRTLKPEHDAFGQEIGAYYKGKEFRETVERDDGYFSAHQKAMKFVKTSVLDIGCGAGRHSLYLQEKSFDVLGIDSSPLTAKVCC